MKGMVFTEFMEMVEGKFGYEMVDKIIVDSGVESKGVYTSVGTYPHSEMVQLVFSLSKLSEVEVPKLLHAFGRYLFDTFSKHYATFFEDVDNAYDFFESIEQYIHVEVLKLYPDAELPKFYTEKRDEKELHLVYQSERKMADFALGLLEKGLEYFNEEATIEVKSLAEDGSKVLFLIRK